MLLVEFEDWHGKASLSGELTMHLILFEQDIRSAQISLRDYQAARARHLKHKSPQSNKIELQLMIHYASTFVCAMRRVGRGLESLATSRTMFLMPVSDTIKLVWRKKKAMFDSYVGPRNAIEHISEEISGKTRWTMFNLNNDALCVTEEKTAEVSDANLKSAIDARNEIIRAILEHMPKRI